MLDLSHVTGQEDESGYRPPIVMSSAIDGTGARDVWDAIQAHRAHLEVTDGLAARRAGRLRMEVANRFYQLLSAASEDALAEERGQKMLPQATERTISHAEAAAPLTAEILGRP